MLQVSDLSKAYAAHIVLDRVSFTLNAGDRVGLVGPNGCGKTTLLRILAGLEKPDRGSVSATRPDLRTGYLPQAMIYQPEATVRQVLAGSATQEPGYWADRVARLAEEIAHARPEERPKLESKYEVALQRLSSAARRLPEHVIATILAGLDLQAVDPDTPVDILSGGQKTRLGLARILLEDPNLLLLDEPTNHLDIGALVWLEEYLAQSRTGTSNPTAMLIVSHDRAFLDRVVTRIFALDEPTHALNVYEGNYSVYAAEQAREREKLEQAYHQQQKRLARLQGAVQQLDQKARRVEHETIHYHYRKIAKKVARQATVRKRRLERLLESESYLEKPRQTWDMKLEFVDTPPSGQDVLVLEDLAKSYGDQLLFEGVDLVLRRGERIAVIGANGSGKTTLLRMIAGGEAPTGGSLRLGANVRVGYYAQEQENLDWEGTPLQAVQRAVPLSETQARSFLHFFLFAGEDVFVPIGELSHGERARLSLGLLVLQGCNLLLLDEPINHLDIPSREAFERALSAYEGTVLAVVHDRYFIRRFASGLWVFQDHTIRHRLGLEDIWPPSSTARGTLVQE